MRLTALDYLIASTSEKLNVVEVIHYGGSFPQPSVAG